MADIHNALRMEPMHVAASDGITLNLTRARQSRDDSTVGLHATVNSFSFSGGIQYSELLSRLGFRQMGCTVTKQRETFCREVADDFDVEAFAPALATTLTRAKSADRHLQACGFFLEAREFPAKGWFNNRGDGHTGADQELKESSEDDHFEFRLSWLVQGGQGGWTTHYRAKEQPLSGAMRAAFELIGIHHQDECPEFDFEPCEWRHALREQRGDSFFDANNNTVFGWFHAHREHFSAGLRDLLEADGELQPFGMSLLPPRPKVISSPPILPSRTAPGEVVRAIDARSTSVDEQPEAFEVAISFAGAQRSLAEDLAQRLRSAGVVVFYDRFYDTFLWGTNLHSHFDDIYRRRSRYCVMFISQAYLDSVWTTHERAAAMARSLEERGEGYILPIRVENVEVPGLPPTIGYLPLDQYPIERIAEMLLEKLGR